MTAEQIQIKKPVSLVYSRKTQDRLTIKLP